MAMSRKVPQKVLDIFDKYIHRKVRTLEKPEAKILLEKEFGLTEDEAEIMFNTFDKDKNGVMSIWEFQQFYTCMGDHADQVLAEFKKMDKDGSGKIDPEEARAGLGNLKTKTGRTLTPKEVDFFVKTTPGEDGMIDLGIFSNLLYRLQLYDAPPPKEHQRIKMRDCEKDD